MAANGNQGGRNFAWKSAAVIVSIVLSGVLFVLLGCWETYANLEYPILPPRLFKKWREYVFSVFYFIILLSVVQLLLDHRGDIRRWNALLQHEHVGTSIRISIEVTDYYNSLWPRQSTLLYVPTGDSTMQGVYANMVSFGTILAGTMVITIVPRCGHERWQMIGFLVVQTGMIGSMGSVGVHDKAQAIATIIIVAATVTPPQFLAFGMMSLGLESQADM